MIQVRRELSDLEVSEHPFLSTFKIFYAGKIRGCSILRTRRRLNGFVAFPGSKSSVVPLGLSVLVLEK
jgi:hypothetical protein